MSMTFFGFWYLHHPSSYGCGFEPCVTRERGLPDERAQRLSQARIVMV